jgi:4-oxalocrotonate tautomerase
LNREQKKQLVDELTGSVSRILKTPEASVNVVLKENDPDNIGVGGKLLSELHHAE